MNKTKIIAYIAFVAMLSACGSDDGSGPPELVKSYPNEISPFDTLKVKFNSNLVGLDTSREANVVLGSGITWLKSVSGNELRFIGTNTTPGDLNYFEEGKNDSIVFENIQNSAGYKNTRTVFYFSTYNILDKEPNDERAYANEIDLEKAKKNWVTFAGVLDHFCGVSGGQSRYDLNDYYTIKLKAGDAVSTTVTNREDLILEIMGPTGTIDTTLQAAKGKSNEFEYIVGTSYLLGTTFTASDLVPFYINVADKNRVPTSPPNPYTISIKVNELKIKY